MSPKRLRTALLVMVGTSVAGMARGPSLRCVRLVACTFTCLLASATQAAPPADDPGVPPVILDAEIEARRHFQATGRAIVDGLLVLKRSDEQRITKEDWRHLSELRHLKELWLRGKVTDDEIAHVVRLTDLDLLSLAGTSISDDGLKRLKSLRNLKRLDLGATEITDEGLPHLLDLPKLEFLNLDGCTRITDEGLMTHLKGAKNLWHLVHPDRHVSQARTEKIRRVLPNVFIEYDIAP